MSLVFVVEYILNGLETRVDGVYATKAAAMDSIPGFIEDYERMSDTEEVFDTTEGTWFVTEMELQG